MGAREAVAAVTSTELVVSATGHELLDALCRMTIWKADPDLRCWSLHDANRLELIAELIRGHSQLGADDTQEETDRAADRVQVWQRHDELLSRHDALQMVPRGLYQADDGGIGESRADG